MYLSHMIPGMDALEPVFVFIWNLVHGKDITGEDDMDLLKQTVRKTMYPMLDKADLREITESPQDTWDELIEASVIDENGKLLKVDELKKGMKILNEEFPHRGKIVNRLKEITREDFTIALSQDLLQFVELHLGEWIKNAMLARLMTLN